MMGIRQVGAKIAHAWVEVTAEEKFQAAAVAICQSVTPHHFRIMAERGQTLAELLELLGFSRDEIRVEPSPGVEYLMGCSDEHLMSLLDQVLPEHVEVIKAYPDFSASVVHDLRTLLGGWNGSNRDAD